MIVPIQTTNLYEQATQLATIFHLPIIEQLNPTTQFVLRLTEKRLELHNLLTKIGPIYVDFINGKLAYRRYHSGGKNQTLAKAVGLKPGIKLTILDATAGLGCDAFILASLGSCQIKMLERSPVIAALLYDGLQRANDNVNTQPIIKRLQLIHCDALSWISQLSISEYPDVIYLDPMYPHNKKTALVKKEMRFLRKIVGNDLDAAHLLEIALSRVKNRVVVKRPKNASSLTIQIPDFYIQSKNTRFDIYMKS